MFERGCAIFVIATAGLSTALPTHAALLAYEPFSNAPGSSVIGSADGLGFAGSWQANGSGGVATNLDFGLSYADASGNALLTSGCAALFQGLASGNTSMQPFRVFNFGRGTNGTDGVTTWISFLVRRQGPVGTLAGNPYGRGANIAHDLNSGALQKLAVGNSSGASTNTVGLIPLGNSANLKSSTNIFGAVTNFVVVRIDHVSGASDNAWLFVNPLLALEPSTNSASALSLDGFDFSFDRVRVFAGGQSSASQPYAEIILDEYRVGETFADVTPVTNSSPTPASGILITNASMVAGGLILSGTGGSSNGTFFVLAGADLLGTNWPTTATNSFDSAGNFNCTVPITGADTTGFFRLLTGQLPPAPLAPFIQTQPQSQAVIVSNRATFSVVAGGTEPLRYQWYFNTNTLVPDATNSFFTIAHAQLSDAGAYRVMVSNSVSSIASTSAVLMVSPAVITNGAFFVSPTGSDSNPGTLDRPFLTIAKGVTTIGTGGQLYIRGGTYPLTSKLTLSRTASPGNPIRIWAYPGETVVIDSSGNTSDGIAISGRGYHLKGITVKNAGHNGINISGSSNTVEFCTVHDNGNTGLHITGGTSGTTFPAYNLILNCDAYLNYDPPIGGNADGFSAKWDLGPGNVFSGCRAWWNSDDGWDLWMGNSAVVITNCWAFWQGTNYWNSPSFDGNGNGFKLGGNYIAAPHRLVRSVAFGNRVNGVDQNNNLAGQTVDNCTSWNNNSRNFSLSHGTNTTPHIVRNNLSFAGGNADSFTSGTLATNNSWQVLSSPANASDVQSVDPSVAVAPRQPDGSLPAWPFLRPVSGGRLVDQGIDLGEPYTGSAPDLGAFENP